MITSGTREEMCGMPAAWVTPLSLEPPLIGVAISKKRYTYKVVVSSRIFAVNSVSLRDHGKVMCAGSYSCRENKRKLEDCGFALEYLQEYNGLPVLKDSYSIVVASLTKIVETGDHDFVVGLVKKVFSRKNRPVSPWGLLEEEPLLHVGKKYFATVQKKLFY